ncbi:hypothetical protein LEP1GSC126_3346 [Leptospira kirschneri str. 200801774]|uniref:hypothetical protein n=1 Tax=Leptospira kirschneri TaxID=29507 RepID=UPI0002BDD890|nr:hypothetical protein [Leptospira kirschneri]EMO80212.1 hypothetical protein LEP1GSC126_3346 [Leptospira kirschneri str. 200801774]
MNTFLIHNGDLTTTSLSGSDCLKQRITNRFKLWRGEWEFNQSIGFPWDKVLRKNPSKKEAEALVKSELKKDPEIISIESVEIIFIDTEDKANQYDSKLRTALFRYTVRTIYGIISGDL